MTRRLWYYLSRPYISIGYRHVRARSEDRSSLLAKSIYCKH